MNKLLLTQLLIIAFIFVFVVIISLTSVFRIYFHQKTAEKSKQKTKLYEVKKR